MEGLVIVGSGASAVHFALSVLRKGYHVTMVDVGNQKNVAIDPGHSFNELKTHLADPVRYFLGDEYEGVLFPGARGEYYGFPPNKRYIFSRPSTIEVDATGFEPLLSFAQGGLAEAWTGGVYPLNDQEIQDFPFGYGDLEPFYGEVAERIGITGAKDDLARFFPLHGHLASPLKLDQHSQQLLDEYEKRKDHLNNKFGTYLGRSRVSALSIDKADRKACTYKGRCLWGCPSRSLYTPSITLDECYGYSTFTYIPQMYVKYFKYNSSHKITGVIAEHLPEGKPYEIGGDRFILAAGTLSSSQILLNSIFKKTGEIVKLSGLMDNRQILIPYINLRMVGERYNPETYQYHQLAIGIEAERPEEYVHCQISTLKTALVHPIIQNIPLDLRTSMFIFRNVRAGLGVINVNLHDTRREDNYVTLRANGNPDISKLVINYAPVKDERIRIKKAIGTVKKFLWQLGCVVPCGMTHVRPMGASVHYAGTIPMSAKSISLTCSEDCRSHDFENLYIVDGATFPFLPAKNITMTLMANAIRVADKAF